MTIARAALAPRDVAADAPAPLAASSGRRRLLDVALAILPMGLVLLNPTRGRPRARRRLTEISPRD